MVKQKKNSIQETASEPEPITIESTASEDLRSILKEIKKSDGVIGYILRSTTSAIIDLNDISKITDYAILSSTTFEACEEISELLHLGEVKNVVVEGNEQKMLHLNMDGNNVSIFMEKNADVKAMLKKIRLP